MKKIFIIAEAGVNHNGDVYTAKKLIDAAAESGADAVKFQTFKTEKLVSRHAPKADYQARTTAEKETQYEMIKRLELDMEQHRELIAYSERKGIIFMSTAFDLESIELLEGLGLEIFKVPSGEITNLQYLRKIGSLDKMVILSSGMADMEEIKAAVNVLTEAGTPKEKIIVLHCNTEYPTSPKDVNLRAMQTIRDTLNIKTGYSDHTAGLEIPSAAAALGADVIEKHFTLDRNMPGPDHRASLEPFELRAMVSAIRNIETAMGDGIKRPSPSEMKNKTVARKSIVASRNIKQGEILTEENITAKRPGTGISPMEWDEVIGKKAKRDFEEDSLIEI